MLLSGWVSVWKGVYVVGVLACARVGVFRMDH